MLTVRSATVSDIDAAASVVLSAFQRMAAAHNAFTSTGQSLRKARSIVAGAVGTQGCHALVAEEGVAERKLVGFCAVTLEERSSDIGPIAVHVDMQSCGLGRQLRLCACVGGGSSSSTARRSTGGAPHSGRF